ncbi:MAG: nucleoside deaminase, partial [Mycoplasmatales bacterium]
MEKKIEYMQEAVNLANIAFEKKEIPIGAVVVLNDRIIGYGHNQREGSTKISGHAEIIAIESAARILNSWKLDECELYVTVEPCLMCCGAIIQSRIKKVYIGTKQRKFKKQSYRYYIEN